jgi:hypothetical protein
MDFPCFRCRLDALLTGDLLGATTLVGYAITKRDSCKASNRVSVENLSGVRSESLEQNGKYDQEPLDG